jgi:hypothetical protein
MNSKLIQSISKNQFFIEALLFALAAASFVLYVPEAIMITFTTLAAFYFLGAYLPSPPSEGKFNLIHVMAPKLIGISSAICVIGLQFFTLHFTGFQQMLMIGGTSIVAAGVLMLVSWLQTQQPRFLFYLLRVAILGGLTWYVFLLPIVE